MSEPRLGYFRDISPECEAERKGKKEREERVRACVLRAYASRRESVIDLFREEAGISGLREGSVEEREGDKEREESRGEREEISRVGGEKERERQSKEETDGSLPHLRARTRRSGLADGQRTNDRVLLRPLRPTCPEKEREKEGAKCRRSVEIDYLAMFYDEGA